MKLLFVIGPLRKGGAGRVVCNLSNELVKNNEVYIATTISNKSDYPLDKNVKIICLDTKEKKSFLIRNIRRINYLKKIIKEKKIDVAISFLPEPSYRLMLAKNKKIKTIISDRNDPNIEYNSFFKKLLTKKLYSKSDGFVFQTPDAMNYFPKKIQERSVVIPNPINNVFFVEKPFNGKRKKVIVTVGRLTNQKNHKLLIDAFRIVQKKYKDYQLYIYGEGELEDYLKKYAESLNLNGCIVFKGNSNHLEKELYDFKMFVLSSNYEGMPNALMEAMALGLPCISTDCPIGGPKYLINNNNGLLVPTNDVDELAKAMIKVIEDEKTADEISNNCYSDVKKYNNVQINDMWTSFISKIHESKRE